MKKNPVETILGFCVLVFAALFLLTAANRIDTRKIDGYTVTANFSKIGGLEVGSDVRIAGIKVGTVTATTLNPDDYTADVAFSIDSSIKLPVDTMASIADVGIMGDKYIRLTPGKQAEFLTDHARLSRTENYKSLEDNVSEFIFLSMN